MKIGLFGQEITFIREFPSSNFLLPTCLTGSKWDFQNANLLLAAVNFEPCYIPCTETYHRSSFAIFILPALSVGVKKKTSL